MALTAAGAVDAPATATLCSRRRATRAPTSFDRGPGYAHLSGGPTTPDVDLR